MTLRLRWDPEAEGMAARPLERSTVTSNRSFLYSLFGLRLRSNFPLPIASESNWQTEHCDIELHFGISPLPLTGAVSAEPQELTYASSETNANGEPALRIFRVARGAFVRLAYEDGTEFWLDRIRKRIWATWSDTTSSLDNTVSYLLGPVLGLTLRLLGVTCLHASAVAFGKSCVAFVGATGTGKSTTAAAFARQGHRILSDDIVALVERGGAFTVLPGYPCLCLWPESVKMLGYSPDALSRIVPDGEKRRLALGNGVGGYEKQPLPLAAVYFLGERRLDSVPYVESLRLQPALLALLADTYANKILDRDLRAREFDQLCRLVEVVPVRRVIPSADSSRLGDLCRTIREDYAVLELRTGTPR